MKAFCRECAEEFDWDESTGDGAFCSWECSDKEADREESTRLYWSEYGRKTTP